MQRVTENNQISETGTRVSFPFIRTEADMHLDERSGLVFCVAIIHKSFVTYMHFVVIVAY